MVIIDFNKEDFDVSKTKLGLICDINGLYNGKRVNFPRVIIKEINIEENSLGFEPLIKIEKPKIKSSLDEFNSIKIFNTKTNEVILKIK